MDGEPGPLTATLTLVQQYRDARAEALWRSHRDKGSYSDQQWHEGYADALEDVCRGIGLRPNRNDPPLQRPQAVSTC